MERIDGDRNRRGDFCCSNRFVLFSLVELPPPRRILPNLSARLRADVCLWPLADMATVLGDVPFQGERFLRRRRARLVQYLSAFPCSRAVNDSVEPKPRKTRDCEHGCRDQEDASDTIDFWVAHDLGACQLMYLTAV